MNFCTLFNSNYLSRGLALYYSLLRQTTDFHLYIFAFDEATYHILSELNLPHVTVISLKEFETPELLAVKPTRTLGEYCWTCTSSIILYCLETFHLSEVCYLDADLYFFGNPKPLLREAAQASILITDHRYTKAYDHSALSGKYCVQFMVFKNDDQGLAALRWWREACIQWCYNRVEPGRFGDQKYLDDWLTRFQGVRVLQHVGGGLAPWNVQQYRVISTSPLKMCEEESGQSFSAIFYHFHGLKFVNDHIDFGGYRLSKSVRKHIYLPYVKHLLEIEELLNNQAITAELLTDINLHAKMEQRISLFDYLRMVKKRINGTYNVIQLP